MTQAEMTAENRGFRCKIARFGFALGIAASLAAVSAGLGNRFGWWSYRDAFAVMPWIVYSGISAVVVSFLGVTANMKFSHKLTLLALIGLILGATVVWIPYHVREALRASPRLSDITTDTANPPAFSTALELRKKSKATNPTVYTPEKAALQAINYPDIKPVILSLPPEQAFDKAVTAMNGMGFIITSTDRATGRIEAYDQSFWFGFIDDMVVRISATPTGSQVDIRSSSRVGIRDAGINAKRIVKLVAALKAK